MLYNTKAQKEALKMFREVGKTKKNRFWQGFWKKQTITNGKCWKSPQNSPPSTSSSTTTTKMTEKYNNKESHKESLATQISACSKSISAQSFSCREKRCGLPSGYKSEISESVCTLYSFQNGNFPDFTIYDEGKRFHV